MIYIGIGSNLPSSFGNRFKNINLAISFLQEKKIKLIKKSSFYEKRRMIQEPAIWILLTIKKK